MNAEPALEIIGLEKRHPHFTLGPVSLSVPKGVIYGLIGPNGAGKTTLIDTIFGMGDADAGTIRVCGLDHRRDEVSLKLRTGYAGPELNFNTWTNLAGAIRFVRSFHPTWDDAYAAQLMEKLELAANTIFLTASFGTRMKVALLLALAWKPQVLVLDEPTTGLDARARQALFTELLAIVRDEDRSVLVSSHQITDLERFADCIGILHRGRLLVDGVTGDLVERFVQVLFNAPSGLVAPAGLVLQEREGDFCRALVDTQTLPLTELERLGARDMQHQAPSLEELFLNLTR